MISVGRWGRFEQWRSCNWTNGFDYGHNFVVQRLFRWWLIQIYHLLLISVLLLAVRRRRHKDASLSPRPFSDYFLFFFTSGDCLGGTCEVGVERRKACLWACQASMCPPLWEWSHIDAWQVFECLVGIGEWVKLKSKSKVVRDKATSNDGK